MSKYIKLKDVEKVIDRFAGYLDDDMIYRIKYKINHDCQLFEEFTSKGKWVILEEMNSVVVNVDS